MEKLLESEILKTLKSKFYVVMFAANQMLIYFTLKFPYIRVQG
jgi:hypothetical protein